MAFTYDPTTNRGRIRLIVGDRDTQSADNQFFQDDEIDAFLAMEGDSVKRAAAAALDAVATNEALVQKVIRLMQLSTNGAATAAALRAHADKLRQQADAEEFDGAFDVAEGVFDAFSARERIVKQAQRGAL